MPIIRPITELRNTTEISELCHNTKEPVFITRNGYGDLVIMSVETYERLFEVAAANLAVAESMAQYEATGEAYEAGEALKALRKKHLG